VKKNLGGRRAFSLGSMSFYLEREDFPNRLPLNLALARIGSHMYLYLQGRLENQVLNYPMIKEDMGVGI
jgi:hypothetical protein